MSVPAFRATAFLLALLLLGLPARHPAAAPTAQPAVERPTVLLIGIDGLHPERLERLAPPTLLRWRAEGAWAEWMTPAYPTLTFPNHYTLVTGLVPDRHGIVGNRMLDPELGPFRLSLRAAVSDGRWYEGAEPLWVTARRAGLRSATLFWPGSEARIRGLRPNDWLPYAGDMPHEARVDRVLGWLDRKESRRPHFITLYFAAFDEASHAHGPDSDEAAAALAAIDAALARLEQGLRERGLFDSVDIVLVSDHGMAEVDVAHPRRLDARVMLHEDEVVTSGEVAGIAPRPGREAEIEAALLGRHEGFECWRREALPPAWRFGRHPRIPPIVCQADEGVHLTHAARLAQGGSISRGAHGYAPELPSMRAVFLARGPRIVPGTRLPPIHATDVHPLLLTLLGLPPMVGDGDAAATAAALRLSPAAAQGAVAERSPAPPASPPSP
ncbi:ectonucleotide pyrophosphatase/phosphodiesterase [Silanimonas lenta]|uniref:alkaline phosphatase family protein n=1 Tax=Silanimonas lenta TaxID=265429 RepID=UPI0004074AA6|nr:ectonucleotide pyrophosphatase/phosphodiesterase [Silanimonas lenta]